MKPELKKTIALILVSYCICGLGVSFAWYDIKEFLAPRIPPVMFDITTWLTLILIPTVGLMVHGVLPVFNRLRIFSFMVGVGAFFINLLGQINVGNVALEIALVVTIIYSAIANGAHHEPISTDRVAWKKALSWLGCGICAGLIAAYLWPSSAETQWSGWWWGELARFGGFALFACVALLECRAVSARSWIYASIFGSGNIMLTLSYLGQYNTAGLILNVSLAVIILGPLAVGLLNRPKHAEQTAP